MRANPSDDRHGTLRARAGRIPRFEETFQLDHLAKRPERDVRIQLVAHALLRKPGLGELEIRHEHIDALGIFLDQLLFGLLHEGSFTLRTILNTPVGVGHAGWPTAQRNRFSIFAPL